MARVYMLLLLRGFLMALETASLEETENTNIPIVNSAHSDIVNKEYVDEVDCKGELVIGINKDNSSKFIISETFMDISFSKDKLSVHVKKFGSCCWHVFPDKNCRRDGVLVEDDEEISLSGKSMSVIRFDPIDDVCRSIKRSADICRYEKIPGNRKYVLKNLDGNSNSTATVDGISWTPWSSCTSTCGGGNRRRHHCNKLQRDKNICWGKVTQEEQCNTRACPVDGFWGLWGSWASCSRTCGGGRQTRSRLCNEPQHGGHNCVGDRKKNKFCNTHSCPEDDECSGMSNQYDCCTSSSPCGLGQGDCDSDSECSGSLICGTDNCKSFNSLAASNTDCCIRPSQTWVQKNDQDCWHHCGGKTGSCPSFCGSGGYCCRKGYDGCPDGTGEASPDKHTCVIRGGCFPGESVAVLNGGEKIRMEQLRIGDVVMTLQNGKLIPTTVLGFLDKKINQTTEYLNLITDDDRSLFISPRHAMFIKDENIIKSVLAKDIKIGNVVMIKERSETGYAQVKEIIETAKTGAYVPLTDAGTLLVDGVLVSCYTNGDHWVAHVLAAPARWWPTLVLDNEESQDVEGIRTFPRLLRDLAHTVGLATMADQKTDAVDSPVSGISQLAMTSSKKTDL